MSSYTALPPHIHHGASRSVQADEALAVISSYLEESKSAAYLHPDCTFTELGPTFASNAATGGLVLNQLRRIEAGLSGTVLGANPDGELLAASATVSSAVSGAQELYNEDNSIHMPYKMRNGFVEESGDSRLDSYQNYVTHGEDDTGMVDQSIVEPPSERTAMERDDAMVTNDAVDEDTLSLPDILDSTQFTGSKIRREVGMKSVSKEDRKRAKKEKRKKEKREAHEKASSRLNDILEGPSKSDTTPIKTQKQELPREERRGQTVSETKKRRRKEREEDNISRKRQRSVEYDLERNEETKSNGSKISFSTPVTTTNGSSEYLKSKNRPAAHEVTPEPSSASADEHGSKRKSLKTKRKRTDRTRDLDTHVNENRPSKGDRIATPDATPSPTIVLRDKDDDNHQIATKASDNEKLSKEARKARKHAKKEARSARKEKNLDKDNLEVGRKRHNKSKEQVSDEVPRSTSREEKKGHKSKDKSKRSKEKES